MILIPLPTGEYYKIPEDKMTWEDDLKWLRSFEPKRVSNEGYPTSRKYSAPKNYTKEFEPLTDKKRASINNYRRKVAIDMLSNGKPYMSENGIVNPERLNLTKM